MPRRSSSVRLDTIHFKQSRARCGPACLKIVLAYFGKHVSELAAAKACRTSRISGTTGTNLVKAARRLGFEAEIFDHADLKLVERWLRRGVPVIVDWMSVSTHSGHIACGHYAVVRGLNAQSVSLQDPAIGGRRRISRPTFLKVWFDFRHMAPRNENDLLIRRAIVVAPKRTFQARPVRS